MANLDGWHKEGEHYKLYVQKNPWAIIQTVIAADGTAIFHWRAFDAINGSWSSKGWVSRGVALKLDDAVKGAEKDALRILKGLYNRMKERTDFSEIEVPKEEEGEKKTADSPDAKTTTLPDPLQDSEVRFSLLEMN